MTRSAGDSLDPRGAGAASPLDIVVVLNPVAGRSTADDALGKIAAAVEARGLRHRIVETGGDDTREMIGRAIDEAIGAGCRRFVAAGGDGTVSMTAAALVIGGAALESTLAIVPTGTANIMARELGIPLSLDEAVALAFDGDHSIELDAIQTGHGPVFTQVGIGLDAQMIRLTSREDQNQKGRLAYVATFVRRALRNRPRRFDLEIDGQPARVWAWQVVVANIGVLGEPPFNWGPGIDPSDGSLDVCVFSARTIRDYLSLIRSVLTGRHGRASRTRFFRAGRRVVVRSHPPMLVQGDGEILGRTPITLDVAPRVLRVCVPKDVEHIEPLVGTPTAPAAPAPKAAPGASPVHEETLEEEVAAMVAQHSRTWVLQGWLRHPFTFATALDSALFLKINALVFPPIVDRLLLRVSQVMHYGEGWAIVAAVMLAVDAGTALRVVVEALPVLWATMLTVNFPLKKLFRRRRPFIRFVRARVLGPKPKDFSFPSGHTAAAFAGALLFGAHVPQWSPFFYALAGVVGFSRVYLGVHFPSDVVIGAVIGTVLAGGYLALQRFLVALWP